MGVKEYLEINSLSDLLSVYESIWETYKNDVEKYENNKKETKSLNNNYKELKKLDL